MKIYFLDVDAAAAAQLAGESRLALVEAGVPPAALNLERASSLSMGPTVLGVDIELVLQVIGGLGYIACFGKCMVEVSTKRSARIHLQTQAGTFDFSANMDSESIKSILNMAITKNSQSE